MKISAQNRFLLWKKKIFDSWTFRYAHHPLCNKFEGHIWHIGKFRFCQGCFLVYLGIFVGLLTYIFMINTYLDNIIDWMITLIVILTPVLIVEIIKTEFRPIKRLIRFAMGFSFGGMFGFVFSDIFWWERLIALLAGILSYILFRMTRSKKEKEDHCKDCPELGKNGVCSGYKEEYNAERKYNQYLNELLQDVIQKKYSRKYGPIESNNSFVFVEDNENIKPDDENNKNLENF